MSKFKIGMLLDREPADRHLLALVEWGKEQHDLEIAFLIICAPDADASALPFGARLASWVFRAVTIVESGIVRLLEKKKGKLGIPAFARGASSHATLKLGPALGGVQFYSVAEPDIERVRALNLDLLIQFGRKEFRGDILGAARLGSLVLDYHGNRANIQVEPGFWEAYHKSPKTRFAIRQHTAQREGGRTIISGAFPTKYLFLLNSAHLYQKSGAQLRIVLRKFAAAETIAGDDSAGPYSGRVYSAPDCRESVLYLAKMTYRVGRRTVFKLFNIKQKWGLSVIRSDWRSAALWRGTHLAAPRGHFWADPFLYQWKGKTYCFVEDFVYATGRAHIAVLELSASGATEIGPCIEEDYHLSFPFLFTYEGQLYMCPESSEARQVRIYRCAAFPQRWELCHIAMDKLSAADSMFFQHGGKWWMMTSIDHSGLDDHCSELYLFSGQSPFEKNWVPHPQNPIRIDPEGGRNAGMIIEGGKLFRGAQHQGFDQYGKGLILYEIVELNERVYHERPVSEISCDFKKGLLGSHHVSTTGELTVFDHVSRCFFP